MAEPLALVKVTVWHHAKCLSDLNSYFTRLFAFSLDNMSGTLFVQRFSLPQYIFYLRDGIGACQRRTSPTRLGVCRKSLADCRRRRLQPNDGSG